MYDINHIKIHNHIKYSTHILFAFAIADGVIASYKRLSQISLFLLNINQHSSYLLLNLKLSIEWSYLIELLLSLEWIKYWEQFTWEKILV